MHVYLYSYFKKILTTSTIDISYSALYEFAFHDFFDRYYSGSVYMLIFLYQLNAVELVLLVDFHCKLLSHINPNLFKHKTLNGQLTFALNAFIRNVHWSLTGSSG